MSDMNDGYRSGQDRGKGRIRSEMFVLFILFLSGLQFYTGEYEWYRCC